MPRDDASGADVPPMKPGDTVHLRGIGTGVIREIRGGGRVAVTIKNTLIVVRGQQLEPVDATTRSRLRADAAPLADAATERADAAPVIDLHGTTVAEAEARVDAFLDAALRAGLTEVRVIHGRSGGRLRAALHARLKQVPSVRAFRLDPRNPGVTIVTF
jgi:DNA mismatch repair protein MutS2